jgi:hypothetical protein
MTEHDDKVNEREKGGGVQVEGMRFTSQSSVK